MSFLQSINNSLDKVGEKVTIINSDKDVIGTRAIINPLRYKNRITNALISIGARFDTINDKQQYYLYIGKATIPIKKDETIIETGFGRLCVVASDSYYKNDKKIYNWAVLTAYKED